MKEEIKPKFTPGKRISYQNAGMPEPEYGVVVAESRIGGHAFVRFDGEERAKLTPFKFMRLGTYTSWWRQDEQGKWHSHFALDI